MSRSWWIAWAVAGWALWCAAAVSLGAEWYRVETRSGAVHLGQVELGDGELRVAGPQETTRVSQGDLRTLRRMSREEVAAAMSRRTTDRSSPAASGLRGEYFPDTEMSDSVMERVDATPNFSGRRDEQQAIDLGSLPEQFSIRWTGQLVPPVSGEYRFWVSSDDGSRVWVNNVNIVDRWGSGVGRDASNTVMLEEGKAVELRIEYMDIGGGQFFQLEWQPPGRTREPIPTGALVPAKPADWPGEARRGAWRAEYFSDNELAKSVGVTSEARSVFDWGDRRPAGVDQKSRTFSMRLIGRLFPEVGGKHRMRVEVDDRVRIFVGEQKVYDTFEKQRFDGEFDLDLEVGTPVAIRVEYRNDEAQGHLRLRWRRPGSGEMRDLPMTAVGLPEGEDVAPMVKIERRTVPVRFFRSDVGERVAEARVWSPAGAVQEVQWLADDRPVVVTKASEDGVFRMPLAALPLGRVQLRVRATDSAGRTSVSEGLWTEAEGLAGGVITGPWRDARVGDVGSRVNLMREKGDVVLRASDGDVDNNTDNLRLVCRPIGPDGCIEARLVSVETGAAGGLAFGGLMIRQSLEPPSPSLAILVDSDGASRVVYRRDGWQPPRTFEVSVAPGSFVRLARETDGVRVLAKANAGDEWKSVWFGEMRLQGETWAGVFAVSRSGSPSLRLSDLAVGTVEPPASTTMGLMLLNGSYISGNVQLDDQRKVQVWTRDRGAVMDIARVAYFGFGPIRWNEVEALSARAPAALMRGEDLSEGELTRLRDGRVVFDSDLFGRVTTEMWSGEFRAIATRRFRIDLSGSPVGVRTRDGSCLRGESFQIRPDTLVVVSPDLPDPVSRVSLGEIADRVP